MIKQAIPLRARQWLKHLVGCPDLTFATLSFSQEGEDLVLRRMLESKKTGFYVDVGALHPQRFSNTYLFYQQGWRGINIEPRPGSKSLFDALRPRDVNLELAVGSTDGALRYYEYDEPALNTFDEAVRRLHAGRGRQPKATHTVRVKTLGGILEAHLPASEEFTFLSVDVEGMDLAVLESNDWSRFRPEVIVAEDLSVRSLDEVATSAVTAFLGGHGYIPHARLMHSMVFRQAASR